jgi:hypothetical protein
MRGKVEVFAIAADGSQTLVASESNLVVDGAGQSIVDMLTVPSATLGIAPRVMDTSNWRFGALSFGPAAGSFSANAYTYPDVGRTTATLKKYDDLCNGTTEDVTSWFNQVGTDKQIRVRWVSGTIGAAQGATASSYTPPYQLPSYPDPLDQKLEDVRTAYAIASEDGTECFGQFENRIQFKPSDASSYFQGAYPRSGTNTSAMLISSYDGNFQSDASANMIVFQQSTGGYNANVVMDYRGFITTQYNAVNPGHSVSRVCVSGSTSNDVTGATSFVTDPRVSIFTTIEDKDVWMMNLFGGLHQMGLWNMNTPKALLSNEPPFLQGNPSFSDPKFIKGTGVTTQEFKLFAKKTFTNNLTRNQDNGSNAGLNNAVNLKIHWTLDFRSDHD